MSSNCLWIHRNYIAGVYDTNEGIERRIAQELFPGSSLRTKLTILKQWIAKLYVLGHNLSLFLAIIVQISHNCSKNVADLWTWIWQFSPALLNQAPIPGFNSARFRRPGAIPCTKDNVRSRSGKNLRKMRTKARLVVGLIPGTLGMRRSTRRLMCLDSAPYHRREGQGTTPGPSMLVLLLTLHRCMWRTSW